MSAKSQVLELTARTPAADKRVRLAAIDIGSNSIRQIIADVTPAGEIRVRSFK